MNIKEYNVNNNGNNPISTNINKNIYSKTSIEKIKEIVEKIIGNKVQMKKNKNLIIIECKYKEGNNSIKFILNISKNNKDFFVISPCLVKGKEYIYKSIIDKIKNKLM